MSKTKDKVIVIGHKNPDTDSVCSAIAYANLKNITDGNHYMAARAGTLNKETTFVLKRFNMMSYSRLILDLEPRVEDLIERHFEAIKENDSVRDAWIKMRDNDVHLLPIVDDERNLEGVVTLSDIALADMDSLDENDLSKSPIPVSNLIRTVDGKLVVGNETAVLDKGRFVVGAGSADVIEHFVHEGDVVLVSNRASSQMAAIEQKASCLVICLADDVDEDIKNLAIKNDCIVVTTKHSTFNTSRLVSQSIPVKHYINKDATAFEMTTPLAEAKEVMKQVRDNHFPVVDNEGKYRGLISKRNLIKCDKMDLILVDHNEKSQCVDGFEYANILGIIDHHRLGDVETSGPVFFRNQPVGCTSTIIAQMYDEENVAITPEIAGIMCCAILSDTLAFRSPTCTQLDKETAKRLAGIAGENLDVLAEEMFEAGEDLSDRTPISLFNSDCKVLQLGDHRIAIGQGAFYTEKNLRNAIKMAGEVIEEELKLKNCDIAFYIATGIIDRSSDVVFGGDGARELLGRAFHIDIDEDVACLPGVISRKKQFVPAIINALEQM